jgi:hypothetical protein
VGPEGLDGAHPVFRQARHLTNDTQYLTCPRFSGQFGVVIRRRLRRVPTVSAGAWATGRQNPLGRVGDDG